MPFLAFHLKHCNAKSLQTRVGFLWDDFYILGGTVKNSLLNYFRNRNRNVIIVCLHNKSQGDLNCHGCVATICSHQTCASTCALLRLISTRIQASLQTFESVFTQFGGSAKARSRPILISQWFFYPLPQIALQLNFSFNFFGSGFLLYTV